MSGVPCIRGLRIPVATVVSMLADGMTDAEILTACPDLEADDIHESLRYAADVVRERDLPMLTLNLTGSDRSPFSSWRPSGKPGDDHDEKGNCSPP